LRRTFSLSSTRFDGCGSNAYTHQVGADLASGSKSVVPDVSTAVHDNTARWDQLLKCSGRDRLVGATAGETEVVFGVNPQLVARNGHDLGPEGERTTRSNLD
jgi:hypothetical protein